MLKCCMRLRFFNVKHTKIAKKLTQKKVHLGVADNNSNADKRQKGLLKHFVQ